MTKIFNTKKVRHTRRILRQQNIKTEEIVWEKLRNRNCGFKFKRQYSIGKYIVDFYCPRTRLVIEIDGPTHDIKEEVQCDKEREEYIKSAGRKIIRYSNYNIYNNLDFVIKDIVKTCRNINNEPGFSIPPLP